MRFKIFANKTLIGVSNLEEGDPPMGVAFGKFHPTDAYFAHQIIFKSQDYPAIDQLNLYATDKGGNKLEPCSGVGIIDLSGAETDIEVSILGLDYEIYSRFFPHHGQKYQKKK